VIDSMRTLLRALASWSVCPAGSAPTSRMTSRRLGTIPSASVRLDVCWQQRFGYDHVTPPHSGHPERHTSQVGPQGRLFVTASVFVVTLAMIGDSEFLEGKL